jgi:hypothetical protein
MTEYAILACVGAFADAERAKWGDPCYMWIVPVHRMHIPRHKLHPLFVKVSSTDLLTLSLPPAMEPVGNQEVQAE